MSTAEPGLHDAMIAAQAAAQAAALQDDNTWPDIIRAAVEAAYPLIAARVRAEERQRCAEQIRQAFRPESSPMFDMGMDYAARLLAAGSAVPVATPAALWDKHGRAMLELHGVQVPVATPPTFDALLSDPTEQFDQHSELLPALVRFLGLPATADVGPLMRSIEEYRNAPPAAFTVPPVATPTEPDSRDGGDLADLLDGDPAVAADLLWSYGCLADPAEQDGWERATTTGPRKAWDAEDTPPEGDGWVRDADRGHNGWERFDYHEESYWKRPKPAEQDGQR